MKNFHVTTRVALFAALLTGLGFALRSGAYDGTSSAAPAPTAKVKYIRSNGPSGGHYIWDGVCTPAEQAGDGAR